MFTGFLVYADVNISDLQNSDLWKKKSSGNIIFYTKVEDFKIPVLCFHKIGDQERYEITSTKFEQFLIFLNENNFFPISDKDYLNNDFSMVPSGKKPIVLGSDDASEGNFILKTRDSNSFTGNVDLTVTTPKLEEESMVYLLEKYLPKVQGKINFTFYTSFNGVPFRQTGGTTSFGENYRDIPIVGYKLNYLIDNFYIGIHTVTHPITVNSTPDSFKWELDEFYRILESYVGDKISLINTLAYPYGCGTLKPEMENMIRNYNYKNYSIIGAFDFDGLFTKSVVSKSVNKFDISRLGVDNKNIESVYNFLKKVKLITSERVIAVGSRDELNSIDINDKDILVVGHS